MDVFEIKDIWSKLLWTGEAASLKEAVVAAVKSGADLQGANLRGANLRGAYLQDADLQGAYLQDADLQGAYLQDADLQGAYLQGADLQGAYLRGADLQDADLQGADLQDAKLRGANLRGANLQDADLQGAKLPDGRTLEEYIAWLPQGLLVQGGKSLQDVAASWGNHSWTDCPMATAFGVRGLSEIPECHRAGAALFVALFDGDHLPKPQAESAA